MSEHSIKINFKKVTWLVFTDPVLEGENVGRSALVEDHVEDDHDEKGEVEGRNGRCWVKLSECNKHP